MEFLSSKPATQSMDKGVKQEAASSMTSPKGEDPKKFKCDVCSQVSREQYIISPAVRVLLNITMNR